jgi:hypothetical protein
VDYEFFESLSSADAQAYLERFLELGGRGVAELSPGAEADGVRADWTVASVAPFFAWLGPRVDVVQTDPPPDLPPWIRTAMEQEHGGFRDFEPESRALVLRAAYYLGQSFVSSHESLEWGLGRKDLLEFQQPVVTGFRTDVDLPALVVAENLFLDVTDAGFEDRVRTVVGTWSKAV